MASSRHPVSAERENTKGNIRRRNNLLDVTQIATVLSGLLPAGPWIEHLAENGAQAGQFAEDNKLEAVAADERDIFARVRHLVLCLAR